MLYAAIDIHKHAFQAAVLDPDSGEVVEKRFAADRDSLARWAEQWQGRVAAVAIEATTGWRWVWRELVADGFDVCLAEPVQTRALLGRRRSAKTDRLDARWLARLLAKEMLPQSWIPPATCSRSQSAISGPGRRRQVRRKQPLGRAPAPKSRVAFPPKGDSPVTCGKSRAREPVGGLTAWKRLLPCGRGRLLIERAAGLVDERQFREFARATRSPRAGRGCGRPERALRRFGRCPPRSRPRARARAV